MACDSGGPKQRGVSNTDYSDVRHFVFTFHDSSFECLAYGFSNRFVPVGGLRTEFDALADRVFSE